MPLGSFTAGRRLEPTRSRHTSGVRADGDSQLRLIPPPGRGACLVEHLRQLLALLLGGPLTCDTMLVHPLIRIGVPHREHLVVMAGDLGHRDRRCPAHTPATLANLIWSLHLTTFCLTLSWLTQHVPQSDPRATARTVCRLIGKIFGAALHAVALRTTGGFRPLLPLNDRQKPARHGHTSVDAANRLPGGRTRYIGPTPAWQGSRRLPDLASTGMTC